MMQVTTLNNESYLFRQNKGCMIIIIKTVGLEIVGIQKGKVNCCYFNSKWHTAYSPWGK